MTTLDMFSTSPQGEAVVRDVWAPVMPAQAYREEQAANKLRVRTGIGAHILSFCREKGAGHVFTAADLLAYVQARKACSPASSDRILRNLAADGTITYSVVDRAGSRYRLESVSHIEATP